MSLYCKNCGHDEEIHQVENFDDGIEEYCDGIIFEGLLVVKGQCPCSEFVPSEED